MPVENDDDADRPRRRRRDEDYDDEDDRPRRRRLRDDDEDDGTGGIIPYKNARALASYYTGVFSLIPVFGLILGAIAIVLGVLGLKYAKQHPRSRGQVHAIIGIVLGTLVLVGHLVVIGLIITSARK